jgi:hypothetical protein
VFTGNERNTVEDNFPITFQFLPLPLLKPKKVFHKSSQKQRFDYKKEYITNHKSKLQCCEKKSHLSNKQRPKETQSGQSPK